MTNDVPTKRQKRWMSQLCVFVFLAVYGLSAFPMSWLAKNLNFGPFNRALEIFYAPLIFVVELFFHLFG